METLCNILSVLASGIVVVWEDYHAPAAQRLLIDLGPFPGTHRIGCRQETKASEAICILLAFNDEDRFLGPPVRVEKIGETIQANENAGLSLAVWVVVIFFLLPLAVIYFA